MAPRPTIAHIGYAIFAGNVGGSQNMAFPCSKPGLEYFYAVEAGPTQSLPEPVMSQAQIESTVFWTLLLLSLMIPWMLF